MESVPDEVLMAYADNALAPDERNRVAALLASDPTLRERFEQFVVAQAALKEIFEPIANEPVPARLVAAVKSARVPNDAILAPARLPRRRTAVAALGEAISSFRKLTLVPMAAVAATVLVVTVWTFSRPTTDSPLVGAGLMAADDKGPYAAGELARALDATSSGRTSGQQVSITPILSFRSQDSRYCRQYRIDSASMGSFSGLACRGEPSKVAQVAWRVIAQEQVSPHAATPESFRPASGPLSPSVETAVERLIEGDVLAPSDEAGLIEHGWTDEPRR